MLWDESEILKILPFYNSYIERPKIKKLSNVRLLKELPFYNDFSIVKNKTAFRGYAKSYKIEIVDKRDVTVQLETSKISIENLKSSDLIEYSTVYLNSLTKTVIGNKYFLDECFNEIIFRLEN